jgi:hypothetical protein
MKTQVARSMTFAFGTFGLKLKSKSSSDFACSKAGATQSHVGLLGVATLDLVGEQPQDEFGVREVVVDRLARAQLEAAEHAGET